MYTSYRVHCEFKRKKNAHNERKKKKIWNDMGTSKRPNMNNTQIG